jgi:lipopolysaccharide export system protein LptA
LTADRLNYLPAKGKIELTGRVSMTSTQLSLKADRLRVELDRRTGRPHVIQASGSVSMVFGKTSGTARKITIHLRGKGLLELDRARLSTLDGKGLRLSGRRVLLQLDTGALVVHQAMARFRAPWGGS